MKAQNRKTLFWALKLKV